MVYSNLKDGEELRSSIIKGRKRSPKPPGWLPPSTSGEHFVPLFTLPTLEVGYKREKVWLQQDEKVFYI